MAEIHEGCCGQHFGHRTLARKILRAGYYWPTIETDTTNYVWRYEKGQKCVDTAHALETSCTIWHPHGHFFSGKLTY